MALYTAAFDLPSLEDRPSIHAAITEAARRLAANRIENRRATLLLYALRIPRSQPTTSSTDSRSAQEDCRPNPRGIDVGIAEVKGCSGDTV